MLKNERDENVDLTCRFLIHNFIWDNSSIDWMKTVASERCN